LNNHNFRWAFIHPFQLRLQRGIEVYLWELASALVQSGVDVDILTLAGPLEIPPYVSPQVRVKRVPEVRYYQHLLAVPYYLGYLVKSHYDHVFVNFADYGEGLSLALARMLTDVPFSVVFHFPPSLVPYRFREFERWGFPKNASHLIAVSQSTANEVESWARRPCAVIGHGVNTERFKPNETLCIQTRKELGISLDALVLISVAALEERKGIQWAIQALPKILASKPDVHYLILGDGPYRLALEEEVRNLGLQKKVSFLGFQKNVVPYLTVSDVALLLSYGEASPVSLLEFAAVGLPVITSRHEPFPELVQPDWGQMVSEQDVDEVGAAIIALFSDIEARTSRGFQARIDMIEHHQWRQVARQYQELVGVEQ
jgi:glycosyltransferase involved in cell wall biosynthesis